MIRPAAWHFVVWLAAAVAGCHAVGRHAPPAPKAQRAAPTAQRTPAPAETIPSPFDIAAPPAEGLTSPAGIAASPEAIRQVIASRADLWGEAALKHPGGPSYAFFRDLLPPLRYVDADFRCYPIVLSAPGSAVKGRIVGDGSAINALARQPNWTNEAGTPVHILVGTRRQPFGRDPTRLDGPTLKDGFLPLVSFGYRSEGQPYRFEVFAPVEPELASSGAIAARFDFPSADAGRIELRFESGHEFLSGEGGVIRTAAGAALAIFDDNWEFNAFRASLTSRPKHAASAAVIIFTEPRPLGGAATTRAAQPEEEAAGHPPATAPSAAPVDLAAYQRHRETCIRRWRQVLDGGTHVTVPEPLVNHAARALLVQQYQILSGDRLNYSASNQYARMYANECGDAMRSLLLWGHAGTARKVIPPLFVYRRPASVLHDAAFKLELLADYYFQTRDASLIEEMQPLWQAEVDLLLESRQADGLLPKERYCSDIATPVSSLNNNANAWRGLRDMALVLEDCHHKDQAARLAKVAAEYRPIILSAMEKAIFRNVNPPFVPVALGGEETPPDPITSTRLGSYWNLVIPCVLASEIVPVDSGPATAIIDYIREKGGLCMGMTRVQSNPGVWMNVQNIDDLYGLKYQLALLKRDAPGDVDRVLVGFYGKLAQGMTRDTFIDGEASGIVPLDRFGRQMYLPPNSAANASFLVQLRNLLVQDWDMDVDGRAETLRLAFATPRAWLENGRTITVDGAPTAFGPVSFQIASRLDVQRIRVSIDLPPNAPAHRYLRLRLPRGHRVTGASAIPAEPSRAEGRPFPLSDPETIDLRDAAGHVVILATTSAD